MATSLYDTGLDRNPANYQPTNITFGIMPPPEPAPGKSRVKKDQRKALTAERALRDLDEWLHSSPVGSGFSRTDVGPGFSRAK